ncbi:MAG: DUF2892 domain-containing protein [Candidatus Wallbacteria bacterium HGW-Wallbacteria-1]|uniref:DUF2892 domain-containing protein n=1 Tax=Candidatus Wallbacteria bacterium HGW-Wallbacteria-1 TaxID=2013854 RepID=A0A2N1PNW7_9BACT|nr:MAG: DUF2892 domain-containing protein [Candidatus Wallbacteria bacterium HGW-Wallbacteria-1]
MKVNDWVHVIAGTFIMISLGLGLMVHKYWFAMTGFVGLNLFQYGWTGFCPLASILRKCKVQD